MVYYIVICIVFVVILVIISQLQYRREKKSTILLNQCCTWMVNLVQGRRIDGFVKANDIKKVAIFGYNALTPILYMELMFCDLNCICCIEDSCYKAFSPVPGLSFISKIDFMTLIDKYDLVIDVNDINHYRIDNGRKTISEIKDRIRVVSISDLVIYNMDMAGFLDRMH